MNLPDMPPQLVSREYLRVAGGYGAPAAGVSPAGGLDIDDAGNLATDGDATVDGDLALGGRLRVGGMPRAWGAFLPARELWPPDDAPATGPTRAHIAWLVEAYTMDFVPGAISSAVFNFALPPHYDGRDLSVSLYWTATGGTGGNVNWWMVSHTLGGGDGIAVSYGATYAATVPFQGLNKLHAATLDIAPTQAGAGAFLLGAIRRRGNHADDTFDGTARLIGLRLGYTND